MAIQVVINGSVNDVTKQQLFTYAESGLIGPETPINVNGRMFLAKQVKEIIFADQKPIDFVPTIPDDVTKRLGLSDDRAKARCQYDISDDDLSQIVNVQQLQALDISFCEQLTDAGLVHLTGLTQLKELNLAGCKQFTDAGLAHVAGLSQLQTLDLSNCPKVTDAAVMKLKTAIPGLEIIKPQPPTISPSKSGIHDELPLQPPFDKDSKLDTYDEFFDATVSDKDEPQDQLLNEIENISDVDKRTDNFYTGTLSHEHIEALLGYSWEASQDEPIDWKDKLRSLIEANKELVTKYPGMPFYKFSKKAWNKEACANDFHALFEKAGVPEGTMMPNILEVLDSVRSVDQSEPDVDTMLAWFEKMLEDQQKLVDSGAEAWIIKTHKKCIENLEKALLATELEPVPNNIGFVEATNDIPDDIVKRFGLSQDRTKARCQEVVTDGDLFYLAKLSQLQTLNLSCCYKLTDTGLAHLAGLTQLRTLDLSNCPKVTDAAVMKLKAAIPGLEIIKPQPQAITIPNDVARHLGLSPDRTQANCDYDITDNFLSYLIHVQQLQTLNLSSCEQITDAGLVHVARLTQLKELNLCWCDQLTDAGLNHLKGLPQLKKLHLGNDSQFSNTRLKELKYAILGLEIKFESHHSIDIPNCEAIFWLADDRTCINRKINLSKGISDVTDADLYFLTELPQLQKLGLNKCEKITDVGLIYLKGLSQLESLDLSECKQITDTGLAHLAGLTQLEELNLAGCEQLTDTGLAHIAELTQLWKLNLERCNQLTDAGLAYFVELTQLQRLDLRGCYQITDVGLAHLAELTQLQRLNLSSSNRLTDEGLVHLAGLTQLQALDLSSGNQLTDAGLAHLARLTQLQTLDISDCHKLTDVGLAHFAGLTKLKELSLSDCNQLTDVAVKELTDMISGLVIKCKKQIPDDVTKRLGLSEGRTKAMCHSFVSDNDLFYLTKLPQLQILDLSDCHELTDDVLSCLAGLTQLKVLNLCECNQLADVTVKELKSAMPVLEIKCDYHIPDDVARRLGLSKDKTTAKRSYGLTKGDLTFFAKLPQLHTLDLSCYDELSDELTDSEMVHLAGLTQLQKLDLFDCLQFTDAGLVYIAGLFQLKELSLSGCRQLTDAGLVHLAGLTQLKTLNLRGCRQLTDAGLVHLAGLTQLEELSLRGCRQLTDAGLAYIASGLTQLRILNLRGYKQLTDAGLIHLEGLTQLKTLDISGCKQITDAAVTKLQAAIPGLTIKS